LKRRLIASGSASSQHHRRVIVMIGLTAPGPLILTRAPIAILELLPGQAFDLIKASAHCWH
jgi:hypothetical protein